MIYTEKKSSVLQRKKVQSKLISQAEHLDRRNIHIVPMITIPM